MKLVFVFVCFFCGCGSEQCHIVFFDTATWGQQVHQSVFEVVPCQTKGCQTNMYVVLLLFSQRKPSISAELRDTVLP